MPLALGALGGMISTLGFLALGAVWIASSGLGLRAILQRRFAVHQDWMTRSYALTTSAITLRIYVVAASLLLPLHFLSAYRAIAWLCWVPNLIAAEIIIGLRRRAKAPPQPSTALPAPSQV